MGRIIDNKGFLAAVEGRPVPRGGDGGPVARCPNCGRNMRVPPGKGSVGLGCKECLHCYRYDYATGAMAPLGHIEPPPGHPLARRRRIQRLQRFLAIVLLLLGLAIVGYPFYSPWIAAHLQPGTSAPDGAPGSTLEEIQRQLKSLAD